MISLKLSLASGMCCASVAGPYDNHSSYRSSKYDRKIRALSQARDAILGNRDDRAEDCIWFESTKFAKKIGGKRCYTMGPSLQQQKKIVGPPAAFRMKGKGDGLTEPLSAAKDFIEVCTYCMTCIS